MFDKYKSLDQKIAGRNLSADEMLLFVEISSEIDVFLAEKLSKDISLYTPAKDRVIKFLKKYSFVSRWITAAGVSCTGVLLL